MFQWRLMKLRIALALLALTWSANPQSAGDDRFGGWQQLTGTKTGFFHTQQIDGRWWLVTPDGNAFFSKGVDNVSYRPEAASSPNRPPIPRRGPSRPPASCANGTSIPWARGPRPSCTGAELCTLR